MEYSSEKKVKRVLWAVMVAAVILIILFHIQNPWLIAFVAGLLLLSVTLRGMTYTAEGPFHFHKPVIFLEIIFVLILQMNDRSSYAAAFYYALIADAVINYSVLFGAVVSAACFGADILYLFITQPNAYSVGMLHTAIRDLAMFILVYSIMCLAKYEINQRRKISKMMYELKIKSKQLEDAYIKLRDSSSNIEEITILKERNRIAREIHDTMGHTLTSVLMELEAGERLLKTDKAAGAEKIGLAKGQIRKGLNDIRESVGVLKKGQNVVDFPASLKLLMDETAGLGDIFIRYEISDLPPLSEFQEKAVFRALQEGLTNGIKHGNSSAFTFLLYYDSEQIRFHLQDNGTGCDKVVYGFGLSAMEQRIREVGGILLITSSWQEGFGIDITIPVSKETADED